MSDNKLSLNEITENFGMNHALKDESTKKCEKWKEKFYEAANEKLEGQAREQRTVEIPPGEDPVGFVQKWHPGWRLVTDEIKGVVALIEEDPAYMPFSHYNNDDGKLYKRSAVPGTPYLDDLLLQDKDPDLWKRISVPDPIMLGTLIQFAEWAGGDIVGNLSKSFEEKLPRMLKPMDKIEPEDRIALADYIIPGKIEIKMLKPRVPKPEEIEGDG